VEEVLELFALSDAADRRTREFSGGMLQRLGLATAFLAEVPLFVLDEPTANLDLLGVDCLRRLLGELRAKGATVVFSSHVLESAMRLADRVAVLVEGELVKLEQAPVFQAAVTHQTTIRVVVQTATDAMVEAARQAGAEASRRNARQVYFQALPERRLDIIRAIERAGATIEEVHTDAPDWDALVRRHFNGEERRT
jgi:ABC-2 type transport system ATP-binding protein